MSNEKKIEFCEWNEHAEKLEAPVKDNERLAKTIRDLRQEIEVLQSERRNRSSDYESRINHVWKKDYEELQMRYEMLRGEKRPLEDEERKLKGRIKELEKRQKALEREIARLAGALNAQQGSNGRASPSEEQCELLKSQMVVYKEDFERERQDRENLDEEKKKYKQKLEDAEEIIRKLTVELDASKTLEQVFREKGHQSENGYLSERGGIPRHRVQSFNSYHHHVDERSRIEQHTLDNCVPESLTQGNKIGHYM